MGTAVPRAPGDRVGPYELVEPLGRGGMGEVWQAWLHGPGGFRKTVAVKLLRPEFVDDAGVRDALLREGRLGARLQHPNVVGTLGVSQHEQGWVVALELVRGASISQLLHAGGALPALAVIDVGTQVAAGLAHAHQAGLVHRDVKPANLLVDRTGLVKLADLGISMLAGEGQRRAAGTVGYMPPEQADGRPEPRSDLFALGATLYRVATGRRPFVADPDGPRRTLRSDEPVAAEAFRAPLAAMPGMAEVIARCLRVDPAERWADARELADALAGLRSAQDPSSLTLLEVLTQVRPGIDVERTPAPSSLAPTRVMPAGNLLRPRDRFVGRTAELGELVEVLRAADDPIVTLVGPGGVGKTRLAVEAARAVQREVHGGAWTVDLSEAHTAEGVCTATADALGLELGGDGAVAQLGRALRARGRAVVLLDNLEQCVAALPETLGAWADDAPEVTFLCTSRVRLRLRGERLVAVAPVSVDEALALFEARVPRPLDEAERPEARALCAELDGLPLAVELAAARAGALGVAAVRQRLSLAVLSGGGAERPERHRSVEASLEWSVSLLSPEGRAALGLLSVFEGGFDLLAAEAVLDLGGAADAVALLTELADASLLRVDPSTGRFSMLVVVREFAVSRAGPERDVAEERHGRHFAQLGSDEAIAALERRGGTARVRALQAETDNVVAACRRAVARGDAPTAVAALQAAWEALRRRGPIPAAAALATSVLALPSLTDAQRCRVARVAGDALHHAGRPEESVARLEASLRLAREHGDRHGEASALALLGSIRHDQGEPDTARTLLDGALELALVLGDRLLEARTRNRLGNVDRLAGHVARALEHQEIALGIARDLGNATLESIVSGNLSLLHGMRGDMAAARALLDRAQRLQQRVGNRTLEVWFVQQRGRWALAEGRVREAQQHYRLALLMAEELGELRQEARILSDLGTALIEEGRLEDARRRYEASLALHRELGARRSEAHVVALLATLHHEAGELDEAYGCYRRALAIQRDLRTHFAAGMTLSNLSRLHLDRGQIALAEGCVTEALQVLGIAEHAHQRAFALLHLARLREHQDRLQEAAEHVESALAIFRTTGDRRMVGESLHQLARLALADGDVAGARRQLGRAEVLLRESGADTLVALMLATAVEVRLADGDRVGAEAALREAESRAPAGQWEVATALDRARATLDHT